jgi:hypothetical protein
MCSRPEEQPWRPDVVSGRYDIEPEREVVEQSKEVREGLLPALDLDLVRGNRLLHRDLLTGVRRKMVLQTCSEATPIVSFVFCSTLLHQITLLARHRVRLERLLAHFASTGVSIRRDWSNDEA